MCLCTSIRTNAFKCVRTWKIVALKFRNLLVKRNGCDVFEVSGPATEKINSKFPIFKALTVADT